jgi:hypothetical protein
MAHLGNQGDEGDLQTRQHGLENLAMWTWELRHVDLETWQSGLNKRGLGNLPWWIWKLGNLALANRNLERKNSQV